MYAILKEEKTFKNPKSGWGKRPKESDIDIADDIERIHYYRNLICHSDASNMKTSTFNESVLDLLGVTYFLPEGCLNYFQPFEMYEGLEILMT